MRKISSVVKHRLIAQAQEAEYIGLEGIPLLITHVLNQLGSLNESQDETISVSLEDESKLEKALWEEAVCIFDDMGTTADAQKLQELVNTYIEDFCDDVKKLCKNGVPGEDDDEGDDSEDEEDDIEVDSEDDDE